MRNKVVLGFGVFLLRSSNFSLHSILAQELQPIDCHLDCNSLKRNSCIDANHCGSCFDGYIATGNANAKCNSVSIYIFIGVIGMAIIVSCFVFYYYNWKSNRRREQMQSLPYEQKDSFIGQGDQDWQCIVCYHENWASKKTCDMCGTSVDYIGEHAQSFEMQCVKIDNLNQNQRAARRRHVWKRVKDQEGNYQWVQNNPDFCFLSMTSPKDEESRKIKVVPFSKNMEFDEHPFSDDTLTRFSMGYIRFENEDGNVEWKAADEVFIPSKRIDLSMNNKSHELDVIAALPFGAKSRWFIQQTTRRYHNKNEIFSLNIRRKHVLEDSMKVINENPQGFLEQRIRIDFDNECGIDLGGLYREWIHLVCTELFKESRGLFIKTHEENLSYWINPLVNNNNHSEDTLKYFRFFGRFMGKILVDGQVLSVYLALPLLKHIIGVPISPSDLDHLDQDLYRCYKWIEDSNDVSGLNLDFSSHGIDWVDGGSQISLDNDNKQCYLYHMFKFHMFNSISDQLGAFLDGVDEVFPQHILQVFDYKELELILCGLPVIDLQDWQKHTDICSKVKNSNMIHQFSLSHWFWETLTEFSEEQRARLLQFTTGSSRVPVEGFKALQSSDGRRQQFTIEFVERKNPPFGLYPKAQTCFNKLILPIYQSKEELAMHLKLITSSDVTGFSTQ